MRIAVLDDYQEVAEGFADWSRLSAEAEIVFFHDHLADPARVVERLEPFEIVCAMRERTPLDSSIIEALPNLRLIVTTGMRNASIDVAAAEARGVVVCGTESPGHATAELAFGLVIALARGIVAEHGNVRAERWQQTVGRDLKGATLGVIGLGRLGGLMARYGRAFGMVVLAWSENLTAARAAECGARLVAKQELFRQADFVTVHLRLSARTAGLVGAAELALMKPDASLINSSRGPIVDTAALVAALEAGCIAGAALDVYDREPLPANDPLRKVERLVLTPHIGYVTRETYRVFYEQTVEDILAFLRGAPVREVSP